MAAEQPARDPAVGALGTVFVDYVEQGEFSPRCRLSRHCHSPSLVEAASAARRGRPRVIATRWTRTNCRRLGARSLRSWTRSGVLKVRGGQFSALAHNVVGELLPFMQAAHSGAFDGRNMHEDVFSAIRRLNEAEALLRIEKLDRTLSHIRPPLKTPVGVRELHDIAQPCVRIQRCRGGKPYRTGKTSNAHLYRPITSESNPPHAEDTMSFKPNYGRHRAERGRAARTRQEEKQRKKEEKTALRKAERAAAKLPPDDKKADASQDLPGQPATVPPGD